MGIKTKDLRYIFDHICIDRHDSLTIDTTRPHQLLRKNLFEVIPYMNGMTPPPATNPKFKKLKDNLYNSDEDEEEED